MTVLVGTDKDPPDPGKDPTPIDPTNMDPPNPLQTTRNTTDHQNRLNQSTAHTSQFPVSMTTFLMTATSANKTTIEPTIPEKKPSTLPETTPVTLDVKRTAEIDPELPTPRHEPAHTRPTRDDAAKPTPRMDDEGDDIDQETTEMDIDPIEPPNATEQPSQKKIDTYFSPKIQPYPNENAAIPVSQGTTGATSETDFSSSDDNNTPPTSPEAITMDIDAHAYASGDHGLTMDHAQDHNTASHGNAKNNNSDTQLVNATIITADSDKIHTTSTPNEDNNANSRTQSELYNTKEKIFNQSRKNTTTESSKNPTDTEKSPMTSPKTTHILGTNPQGPNRKTQEISSPTHDSGPTTAAATSPQIHSPAISMEIDDDSSSESSSGSPVPLDDEGTMITSTDSQGTTNGHFSATAIPPRHQIPKSHPPTPDQDWIPVRLSWKTKGLTENDGIYNPYTANAIPADNKSVHPHFTQLVIAKVINKAHNIDSDIEFKSSKNETILSRTKLGINWSTNEFKRMFSYSISRQNINVTFWVRLSVHPTFFRLKRSLLPFLRNQEFYLNEHAGSIHHADVYTAGWYSQNHHPDVCDLKHLEIDLNRQLKRYFDSHQQEVMAELQHHHTFSRDWDPNKDFPRIKITIQRPRWQQSKNQTWSTRAVGVTGAKRYRPLLQLLLAQVDLNSNDGKATFVDSAMQHAGREMNNEYGKALSQHQVYLASHAYQIIHGITDSTMNTIHKDIKALPGIISVHATLTTNVFGTWRILTTRSIDHITLAKLDTILKNSPRPTTKQFDFLPYRTRKAVEQVHPALRSAWSTQNHTYTAPKPTPRLNSWTKGPPNVIRANHHTVEKPKVTWNDDRSLTTKATTSSEREQIENLTKSIAELTEAMKKAQSTQESIVQELRTEIADLKRDQNNLKQDRNKNQAMRKHYKDSHQALADGMATLQASSTHHDKLLKQTDAYLADLRRDHNDLRSQVTTYETNRQSDTADLKSDNADLKSLIHQVILAVKSPPSVTQEGAPATKDQIMSSPSTTPSSPKKLDTTKRSRDTSTPVAPEARSPQHKMSRGTTRHGTSQGDHAISPQQLDFNPAMTKPPDITPIPVAPMTADLDDDDPKHRL